MWLILPEFSLSAPGSRVSTSVSADISEVEPSVWWRGKPRAWRSWQRAWKTDPWTQRLFGRMPGPLTAWDGVDQWILSLRDTPASPSVPQGSAKAPTTPDTFGPTSSGSSERYAQGQLFSKTSRGTFDSECLKSSKTSMNWGSMRNGVCSLRPRPELRTEGSASSLWPTATASLTNYAESPESFNARKSAYKAKGFHNGTPLTVACKEVSAPGPSAPTRTGQESPKSTTLRLNPLFVEALMGFPVGWTACEPLETPSSPNKPN